MKQKFVNALSLALIVAMLFTSVALADNVQNDVVAVDGDKIVTITSGSSATVNYQIAENNGDGQRGCNAADATPATVTINVPVGVTANPASLSFTSCNTNKPVSFSSSTVGQYEISVSVSDGGAGEYNTNPGKFTLVVNAAPPPANTAPSVVVTGVADGTSYNKGSVPAAMCSVTDAQDGPSSFAATLSAITGPYASDGIGSQTASCSYTDAGGLNATASITYSIDDPSAPVIGYTLTPASPDGSNGWYKGDVSLAWTVTENESPSSLQTTGCVNQVITVDQLEMQYSCSATSAGGSSGPVNVSIKRDGTAPTISGSRTPAANGAGWNNTDVIVSFDCEDATSGVASCTPDTVLSGDGAGQSVLGTAVDNAGNSANATVSGINIDKTAPSFNCTVPNQAVWYGSDVTINCTASDGGSGLANPADASFTLTTSVLGGEETASASTDSKTISDGAGNSVVAGPYTFMVDKKAPSFSCGSADGQWHATDVTIACTAADGGSGLATPATFDLSTNVAAGTEDANASTGSAAVTDIVGNSTTAGPIAGNKVDKKAPFNISFVGGGIVDGGSYYFGFVPAGPTGCTADDSGSGLASCAVTGGGTTVGLQSYLATATDNVGNFDTATRSYTVTAWALNGFYQPVDMDKLNTVKGGSTVPLKFEVFAGPTELTSTAVVMSFVQTRVTCDTNAVIDEIEVTSTGGTSLRYDATAGQFIQNWQTPRQAGACYRVTMTTQDGSSLVANFKLK